MNFTKQELDGMMSLSNIMTLIEVLIHFDLAKGRTLFKKDIDHIIERYMDGLTTEERKELDTIIQKVFQEKLKKLQSLLAQDLQDQTKSTQ